MPALLALASPASALSVVHPMADAVPTDNAVVAGGVGAVVFILLILAVILLGRSLVVRLKNVDRAEAEGLYGESTKKDVHQKIPTGLRAPKPPVQP